MSVEATGQSPGRPARWPLGSWKRIAHASVLGLLQPAVPAAIFGGLGWLLFDGGRKLAPPRPSSLVAVALVGALAVALLVGGGLMGIGRVSASELGFRKQKIGWEVLLGAAGTVAYLGLLLPDRAPSGARLRGNVAVRGVAGLFPRAGCSCWWGSPYRCLRNLCSAGTCSPR